MPDECHDSGCRRREVQERVYRLRVQSREDTGLGDRGPAQGGGRAVLGFSWEVCRCRTAGRGSRAGCSTQAQGGRTGEALWGGERGGPAPLAPPDGADTAAISWGGAGRAAAVRCDSCVLRTAPRSYEHRLVPVPDGGCCLPAPQLLHLLFLLPARRGRGLR